MAWYDEAVFYHIYPLGATGAPKQNDYGEPVHRLNQLLPWVKHLERMHFNALYIGPLFESVGHGYETTDYKKLDSRLGTNDDLKAFVACCHEHGIRVIFDGVFNHTGRDFFAFRDLVANREQSPYRDWYCNVNFCGNNEYHDGFSYENWGGYNLLVKLNQRNPQVRDYICDVIRFWVDEFDVDGIRLDAADVLDFDFMKALRAVAEQVKPEFWLMGEVIHGDYSRWANESTLHSVTNYSLHKALYSGHNDHNYFEIAHTVKRNQEMVPSHIRLYNFVDNHDVERIITKLRNKAHYVPVHILLYTLPGIPSVYYGSEFGIEGKKERYSDDSLRPYIDIKAHERDIRDNSCTRLVAELGKIHAGCPDLVWGDYRELCLTNEQYAFARGAVIVAVNNAEHEAHVRVKASQACYTGLLTGQRIEASDGWLNIPLKGCDGDILVPGASEVEGWKPEEPEGWKPKEPGRKEAPKATDRTKTSARPEQQEKPEDLAPGEKPKEPGQPEKPEQPEEPAQAEEPKEQHQQTSPGSCEEIKDVSGQTPCSEAAGFTKQEAPVQKAPETLDEWFRFVGGAEIPEGLSYQQMTVPQLQAVILGKMAKNGPVTDQMKKDVMDNIWHDSLVRWAESFRS